MSAALLAAILIAGCATGQLAIEGSVPAEWRAEATAYCESAVASGDGLDMIIGVGVGVHRGLEADRAYRAAYENCLAAPLTREDAVDEEASGGVSRKKGLTLVYDVAHRFAQPLGIHLDLCEGRINETDKGVVRLLPVRGRAAQLCGEAGAAPPGGPAAAHPRRPGRRGTAEPEETQLLDAMLLAVPR